MWHLSLITFQHNFCFFPHKDIIIKIYKEAQDLTSVNHIDTKSHRTGFVSHHLDVVVTHKEEVIIFCSAALDGGENPADTWTLDASSWIRKWELAIDQDTRQWFLFLEMIMLPLFGVFLRYFIVTQWHHFHLGLLCDREKLKSIFTFVQQDIILFLLNIVCAIFYWCPDIEKGNWFHLWQGNIQLQV